MKGEEMTEQLTERVLSPSEVHRLLEPMDAKDRSEAFKDLAKSHETLRERMLAAEVEARGAESDVRQLAELRDILANPIGKVTVGECSGVVFDPTVIKKASRPRSLEGRSLS